MNRRADIDPDDDVSRATTYSWRHLRTHRISRRSEIKESGISIRQQTESATLPRGLAIERKGNR